MGHRFFLIGGYSAGNAGDEAILKSTIYALNDLFPGSEFSIWTDKPDFSIRFDRAVSHRIVLWPALGRMFRGGFWSKAAIKAYTDSYPLSGFAARVWARPPRSFLRTLAESDHVVFIGGGYLNGHYSLIQMSFLCRIAKKLGMTITLLGQTVGPFMKRGQRKMADEIFAAARTIVLRERQSHVEVEQFGSKVIYAADDAIAFEPVITPEIRAKVDRYFELGNGKRPLYLGLNLRRWENSRHFYPGIASALAGWAQSQPDRHVRVLFVPMETSAACDDRKEAECLKHYCPPDLDLQVIEEELSVEEKFYLLSRLDLFVGMRLHALIFSLMKGVPAAGLYHRDYYLRKIRGIMDVFGRKEEALPLDQIARLPAMMAALAEKREQMKDELLRARETLVEAQYSLLRNLLSGARP